MKHLHLILGSMLLVPCSRPAAAGLPVARQLEAQTDDLIAAGDVFSRAVGLSAVDGQLVGAGPGYKIEFDARGFTYVPALGERAPRELPLCFELESVQHGAQVLYRSAQGPGELSHEGLSVRYQRSAGWVERYDLRPDGVEQSFRFDELSGTGDLVVRGRLSTELEASALGSAQETLSFTHPDLGGVRIGAVTGIDARGTRAAGWLWTDGEWLELGLPASFVDRAALPLVLDPVIGNAFLIYSPPDVLAHADHADVAYDDSTNTYLVVWLTQLSGVSSDIHGQRLSSSGVLTGPLILIESGAGSSGMPSVANVNSSHRFLVAWQRYVGGFGDYAIDCRAVAASTGALSPIVNVTTDGKAPELAGESSLADDDALIVYSSFFGFDGVQAKQISVPSAGNPSVFGAINVSTLAGDDTPVISRHGGPGGQYLIGWERTISVSPGNRDLVLRAYTRNLVPLSAEIVLSDFAQDETELAIDGDGSNFLALWQRAATTSDRDIYAGRVTYAAGALAKSNVGPLDATVGIDEIEPDVAYAGSKYIAAWAAEAAQGPFSNYDTLITTLDPLSCMACEPPDAVGGLDHADRHVAVAAQLDSAAVEDDRALVVWSKYFLDLGDIYGVLVEAQGLGGSVTSVAPACGQGGVLGAGAASVGSPLAIRLDGAAPSATVALLNVSAPVALVNCGACAWVPFAQTYAVPVAGGMALKNLAIPCNPSLFGGAFYLQWSVLPTSASPCPSSPSVSLSNTVQLVVGY